MEGFRSTCKVRDGKFTWIGIEELVEKIWDIPDMLTGKGKEHGKPIRGIG